MMFFRLPHPSYSSHISPKPSKPGQPMTADVYSLRPGIRSQHHQRCSRRTGRSAKKWGGSLYRPLPPAVSCVTALASARDSFHCMQVDTGSRSGETAGWFHPGYSDCFMTARLLKSLLKKRCAEPDSGNSRIIPIIQICNWSGTAHIAS